MRYKLVLCLPLLVPCTAALHAQHFTTSACPASGGENSSWFGGREHACELRSTVLAANGLTKVELANGSITVVGEDRRDIALQAKVEAWGSSQSDADTLLHQVEVITGSEIHAEGPHDTSFFHHNSWSVSFKLRVPRHLATQLSSTNGSISITDTDGGVDAGAVNGALHLTDVGGTVQAHTVNGSIGIVLSGARWQGSSLSAKTVNGSVAIKAPSDFNAHVVVQTVNGSIHVGYPLTVADTNRHHIDSNIGRGGPTLEVQTVNGSVAVGPDAGAGREQREE